jgi:CBS domain-containing protein
MAWDYDALAIHELGPGAGIRRPTQPPAVHVTQDSPALDVMTDLCRTSPATIRPQAPLAGANQFMISRGVRLLLVVDDRECVTGVISAADILGERAMRVVSERGLRRDELTVDDVMTPAARVEVMDFSALHAAKVGNVLETLRRAGRQHLLIVDHETVPSGSPVDPPLRRPMVRGIISLSQIARQLGVAVHPGEVARTFSEIETALGH